MSECMDAFAIGVAVWAAGFVVMGAVTFLTGGEHHIAGRREWGWLLFNLAIWPLWAVVLATASVVRAIDRYS
jgi:hypothetical protein